MDPASERTIQTPTFLTDLGLRKFTDASDFYELSITSNKHLQDIYKNRPPHPTVDKKIFGDEFIADTLDALVLLWGDYESASNIAVSLKDYLKDESRSYKLLTYAAGLISEKNSKYSEVLYERAYTFTSSAANKMVAKLRRCALVLKKERDPGRALLMLEELENWIYVQRGFSEINESDMDTMTAMTLNLKSLAQIRCNDINAAWETIARARSLVKVEDLSAMGRSEALRYRTQITGNAARLAWLMGKESAAASLWEENYKQAKYEDNYSISETTFGLAYGSYLMGDYSRSQNLAEKAQILIANEASPNRLRLARKVLAGARAKLGDEAGASEVLYKMNSDKLGINILSRPSENAA
ncbi:hypothetical protein [Micrococcus sp.]|uniref:hypothetical protein n=1 Tax=Micrococcus sp. TaxID=1271 RepID=UPI002A9125AE|nr:hypothetical protein [Micrococcus sp.]MDY6056115.1 hypothetical protein [Micrococcus sp.]